MRARTFFDVGRAARTGGLVSRDEAFAACVDRTNRCNDVARVIDMGGPLDAPDLMPAGCCEGWRWVDWRGRPLLHVETVARWQPPQEG